MEKTILTFRADNQILTGQNVPERFASDTVSYIEAVFDLGENWSGFDAVKAVWSTDFDSLCTVLDSSGACVVPHEVLERVGDVWVNLVGSISEDETLTDRLTTYPIKAVVVDANAAVCGSETSPITPSQFDQFVEVVRADADRAEEGATEAAASAYGAAASATSASGSAADASQSASGASQSAQSASESAGSAAQSATSASESAADAEEAKNTILNMTATAQTLPEGSEATVDYNNGVMAFGIPRGDTGARGAKGDTGETGATPQMSIGTVETLEPSEDASVSIRGTAEEPILDFGIPKGETGDVSLLELIANTKVDEKTDSVPYQMRTLSGVGSHESLRKIVGGTVAWNQLTENGDFATTAKWIKSNGDDTLTIADNVATLTLGSVQINYYGHNIGNLLVSGVIGHKYLVACDVMGSKTGTLTIGVTNSTPASVLYKSVTANAWTRIANVLSLTGTYNSFQVALGDNYADYAVGDTLKARNAVCFDLTQMFGTTIADYIYSLEQATAGAGVAFFKALFPEDYYPYDEGTLKSVQTSAHKTYDADGNVIGNYALDNSITLMGIPKLDANNILYYDGDEYPSSGAVNRRFGETTITDEMITVGGSRFSNVVFANVYLANGLVSYTKSAVLNKYGAVMTHSGAWDDANHVGKFYSDATRDSYWIGFPHGTSLADMKTALVGLSIVYEKATQTTETATAYTELQEVESGGSEEFVGAEIPVGHESTYPRTLADTMPTADGSYTLALTVSGGKPSVEWEVNA